MAAKDKNKGKGVDVTLDDDFDEEEIRAKGKKLKDYKPSDSESKDKDKDKDKEQDGGKSDKKKDKEAEKEAKRREKEQKGKGGAGKIIAIVVVLALLAIIGAAVAVVGFNAFGLREKYLSGVISNTPILNNIIKTGTEGETPTVSVSDLEATVAALKDDNDAKDAEITRLNQSIDNYKTELAPLQSMEATQAQFKADKAAFDAEVALGDKVGYAKWYEQISPDTAGELYKEAVVENAADKRVSDYMNKIKGMDAKNVAAALETMMTTDMELVVKIMLRFDQPTASEVLDNMKAQNAADIIRQMEPDRF